MAGVRLVAGLGNPGREYDHTRHNAGFMVLDHLAQRHGLTYSYSSGWSCQWCRWDDALLVKPLTYMNRSGDGLSAVSRFYKVASEEMLVVVDDVALPLGRLRLRAGGSDGGHNGLRSIIAHFGENFARLRIGVGAATSADQLVDHVLGRFRREEQDQVARAVTRAADAVEHTCTHGITAAMNVFNRAEDN
ncbi:MAG: aminoacyl-tRNA hydrolase [Verrucomicrobia bacterium]|nr:aminoacyl-tRNA hydrolase [Verrucomicrobiota bacterium]